ncbi:hypothetical protein EON83_02005 [bacterium]|nr:MAG: hypothetical protein EON83_02005 [bacterium]
MNSSVFAPSHTLNCMRSISFARASFLPTFRPVRSLLLTVATASALLISANIQPAHAQDYDDSSQGGPQTEAALIGESKDIRPGQPFTVALRLNMEKGWHVYWRNPGDSGTPTRITWALPAGFRAGAIQWPVPHRFVDTGMVAYAFENELWLLTQITPPANLTPGQSITLAAEADWLICSEQCVPQKKTLGLSLKVSKDAPIPDPDFKAQFAAARSSIPVPIAQTKVTVRADRAGAANAKPAGAAVNLRFASANKLVLPEDRLKQLYFYPADESALAHPAVQKVVKEGNGYRLPLLTSEYASESIKRVRGVLIAPTAKGSAPDSLSRGIWVDVPVTAPTKP